MHGSMHGRLRPGRVWWGFFPRVQEVSVRYVAFLLSFPPPSSGLGAVLFSTLVSCIQLSALLFPACPARSSLVRFIFLQLWHEWVGWAQPPHTVSRIGAARVGVLGPASAEASAHSEGEIRTTGCSRLAVQSRGPGNTHHREERPSQAAPPYAACVCGCVTYAADGCLLLHMQTNRVLNLIHKYPYPFVVGGLGFEFCVFVAGWRHALRSE